MRPGWAWFAAGVAAALLALGAWDCRRQTAPVPILDAWETDPAVWGRIHPREYDSWKLGAQPHPVDLGYGPGRTRYGAPAPASPVHPVSCQACHDPATFGLRPGRRPFPQGEPVVQVCAQCHARAALDPALPGSPAHTEYDLWRVGTHARHGVACPACHMPARQEGTARVLDHALKSPLLDVHGACTGCHTEGERALLAKVEALQGGIVALRLRARAALDSAHASLDAARGRGLTEPAKRKAEALLREGEEEWELVAADGSTGFHAPPEAAQALARALDLARAAELQARQGP